MNDFKVIKNPDGTFSTAPAEAQPDIQKARQKLRDMLDGGGWFEDPLSAPKPSEPEPSKLAEDDELEEWDAYKCRCCISPPCSYCESGRYRI